MVVLFATARSLAHVTVTGGGGLAVPAAWRAAACENCDRLHPRVPEGTARFAPQSALFYLTQINALYFVQ